MEYYTTTIIHLSLEYYTNAGLSQERMMQIIQGIPDPGSCCCRLSCEKACINENINVHTLLHHGADINDLVHYIRTRLDHALKTSKASETT